MNIKKKLTTALLVVAGVAFLGTSAPALTTGDLVLAFRLTNSGGTGTDLEIDLGSTTGFNFNAGTLLNINSDLVATYGANWNTNANLAYSIVAANGSSNKRKLFLSDPGNVNAMPVLSSTNTGYANINGAGLYGASGTATTNGIQVNETDSNSYYAVLTNGAGTVPYTSDYNLGLSTEQLVSSSSSSLDLYKLNGNETGPTTAAATVDLGTFSLSGAGVLSVTQTVPEPASYALGALAMALFAILRRRSKIEA